MTEPTIGQLRAGSANLMAANLAGSMFPPPGFGGVTAATAMANLAVAFGGCPHPNAVPVELLDDGQRVAVLCPDCDAQLPADWSVASHAEAEALGAAGALMNAGFNPADVMEAVGLPPFPAVPEPPPFVPDPRLIGRISE